MHYKGRRSLSLLCVFFLIVLFSLLCAPLLSPASGSPGSEQYDFVDSNTSNVDSSPDKGTHSNFAGQQQGPDSSYDILTEQSTKTVVFEQITVSSGQSTTSTAWTDVSGASVSFTPDSSTEEWLIFVTADIKSSRTSEDQARFRYEVNGVAKGETGVQQGTTSTSPIDPYNVYFHFSRITGVTSQQTVKFQFQASSGTIAYARNIHILCIRLDPADLEYAEVNGDISITGSQTLATLQFTPPSSGDYIIAYCTSVSELPTGAGAETWLDYDSGTNLYPDAWSTPNNRRTLTDRDQFEPHGIFSKISLSAAQHTFRVQTQLRTSGSTSTARDVRIAAFRVDAFDLLEFDEDTAVASTTGANTVRSVVNTLDPGEQRDYLILAGIHTISSGTPSREAGGIEVDDVFVQRKGDRRLSYSQIARIASHYACVKTSSTGFKVETTYGRGGTGSDTIYSKQSVIYVLKIPRVYRLDLEVQWINATYDLPNEELCIFGGTMGSEDIRVDVWSGSTWHNLFTDLSNGWNNVSVSSYLISSTFTIRFIGGTEVGDTSQDNWEIDCTLLHTSGIPPIANFFYAPENPYTGETITFNASGSYDPEGTIVSYLWDFDDGTNGTGMVTTHSYTDDGNYTVVLTVTDNDGLSDTFPAVVTVLNRAPDASFTESAETVYTGETITFNASGSYDPDGVIVSYFWDFGDGANSTGVVVVHAYSDDGNYTVMLTVTDDDGGTDSASSIKTVLNRAPFASFTESAETVYTAEFITFNASTSYDSDGVIVSCFWDFGDGANATGVAVEHAYLDDGNYTVVLMVTDDDGATDSASATKTVLNRSPIASFTESAEVVYTSEFITFNASTSYDPDGSIISYFWDFGDGANATGVTVSHSYVDDGIYVVTLTVTDDDGATGLANATKTVLNRPPIALFAESAETVYTGETITFNASDSYDPDGSITSYFWDFGDGNNATDVVINHAYADDGNYTVTLTITDNDEATNSTSSTKTVLNRSPVALFSESAETVYTGETIAFNASDSYDPDGSITSYFWDFGDGANATGVVVSHSYADDGNYTVTLTVTDDDGATDSTSATKTVLNRFPVANFTESAETVFTGEFITFNASGSYDSDGVIVSCFWDFGDGANATGVAVEHAYLNDGNYTVVLTVTDDDGATGTATAIKTVMNSPPVANFTESAEVVYTDEVITFNASSSYDFDGTIISYFWDFGDGTNTTGIVVSHSYTDDGNYTVTLTVTDDDDDAANATAIKTVLNRPPIASFTESAETVYTNEIIYFNASSSYDPDGVVVEYFWDFGDGTNATGVTIEYAYADDGIYTVTLTVTDNDDATASTNATKTVLNRAPVAIFDESAETVYTGEVIYFNASGSYDPDGSIFSYFWGFGDGTNATGMIVEHAYADNGTYTVTLLVTDDDGATSSTNATKTILNRPPIAVFTESAETVYTGDTISFNASGSYDSDGFIVSYFWDFGDGANATSVIVEHTYADDGNYTVTLTVTDDDGASATANATKTILNRAPVANFTESAEVVYKGEPISFNASGSYDSDGFIVSYFWDFGDGVNGTGVIVSHSYADDGNYTVTLTVTDDDGATDSASAVKTVLNRSPVANFTESEETVYTGEPITFNASDSYDPDGVVVSYFWDFGDGTNVTGVVVEHAYADDGNYTVTLTVTDDDGATGTATAVKTVFNRSPVASFTESAEIVYTGESIMFNASGSYDPDGVIVSYFWDFGDGINATGVVVEHNYVDNGNYTVTLTVTDDDSATDSTTATKTVLNRPPVASFTESAETVHVDESIYFNASGSYDPDGSIVEYFWDFGDGSNDTGVVVEHAYAEEGNYTVTLTVTDDDGASNQSSATKTVTTNEPPVASFTESAETAYTDETIYFNASGSYDSDGSIVEYFWDFGDGVNATGVTAEHAYADDGNYTVTLTVTDDDGASDSASAIKTVLNRSPVANFTESAETVFTGESIYFNASGSYDSDGVVVSYFWDFGDGTNTTGVTVEHAYADNGNYTVMLTVTDDDGGTDSASSTKTVLNQAPFASFTESAETVYTGEVITFNASSSYDPDGMIVSYFWGFGDGVNGTGVVVSHAYSDDGNYTVVLMVTDDDGGTASANATKTVLNRAPVAIFDESAETVYTGEVIYFNASGSYDSDGVVVSYFWDFGDGTNATGVTIGHAYADDGNYTVILTVTDDDGASANTTALKTILNRPPSASLTYTPDFPIVGETVTFNASESYDIDGTIANYTWDFGDGNVTTASEPMITHTYTSHGNYTVTLTVTDNDGETGTTAEVVMVKDYPVADFTYTPTTPFKDQNVTFDAGISDPQGGVIVWYFWDFGDESQLNTTDSVSIHIYTALGNYNVTLTVMDSEYLNDTTSKVVTVAEAPPVANFTYTPASPAANQTITFNASESYDPNGHIVSHVWNFGDGNITTTADPVIYHEYAAAGNYTVTLTVTDNDGLTDTKSKNIVVGNPPTANFTYAPEYPYVGDTITFNASSSTPNNGTIVSYSWDFGDGSPPVNETDPITTYLYDKAGNFTVTLTITDDNGLTSTAQELITILKAPVAVFAYSPVSPTTFVTITFNASESHDPNGYIVSYVWDFGDGNTTTVMTPTITHYYTNNGNYTVILIISDNDGYTDSTIKDITVLPHPPTANFTYTPDFPIVGETVTFNASESYDIDGIIANYTWDFGDGNTTTTTDPIITHTYTMYGNYTVILTVTDSDGLSDNKTSTVEVRDYPTANFTWSPEICGVNRTTTFNASLSTPNGGVIVLYFWDFGDGSQLNTTDPVATHTYAAMGNYTITLTVTDSEDLNSTTSKVVQVVEKPTATFTYSPEFPIVSDTVTFNASESYCISRPIANYTWDFGDGNVTTTTDPIITHTYVAEGNYTVKLTVTDTSGYDDTCIKTITVRNYPVADFVLSPDYPIKDETTTFDASSSDPRGGSITTYVWDFGDSTELNTTDPITTHTFTAIGEYNVTLTVIDSEGLTNAISKTVKVRDYPTANFTWSPIQPTATEPVIFNASTSEPNSGVIDSYVWDFGDGNTTTTTERVISHTYENSGNYSVVLTVTNSKGLNASLTKNITVFDAPPIAQFEIHPETQAIDLPVTFNASGSYDPDGYIANYTWDFGDGNTTTTTEPTITHIYENPGNYTVALTVTDSQELNSSISKTVEICLPPAANFTLTPTDPFAGDIITFNASDSYDPDGYIANYTWDFGDGNTTTTTAPIIFHTYAEGEDYQVKLVVSDNKGLTDTVSTNIHVKGYPIANFTQTPDFPIAGEKVTFDASLSSPNGGTIANYTWDFGDDSQLNTTDPVVTHTYETYGNFTVTLTIVDSDGLSGSTSKTIKIRDYPTASFTYSPHPAHCKMPTALNATASDPNGGTITLYVWDFGDGSQLNTTDPMIIHVFEEVWNYYVNLTVYDDEGLSSSFHRMVMVLPANPVASFTYTPENPTVGESIKFNASDSYDADGWIVHYFWDFGDGTNATGVVVYHTFSSVETYDVTLTVTDNDNNTNTISETVEVIGDPSADFTWSPSYVIVLEPTVFNASLSSPGSGVIMNYTWDFGDGNITTTTDPLVTHTFSESGRIYWVTLTIINSDGLSDSTTKWLDVYGIPYANFTWTPAIPLSGETTTFNASASEPNGGYVIMFRWDFGDGSPPVDTIYSIIDHDFATYGIYNVTLEVRNGAGLVGTVSEEITVLSPPNANFTWTPESPYAYDLVAFDASLSSPGSGAIMNYTWDFGDGNTTVTTDPVIIHYYLNGGNHIVTLNVTNSDGLSDTIPKTISVAPAEPPTAEFTYSPHSPGVYGEITFNATDSTARGGVITSYTWDFGDGNVTTITTPIVYYTYQASGNYTVTLNVTNTAGYWSNVTRQIEVSPISNPNADFTWFPPKPYFNQTVNFDASASTPGWNGTAYPPIITYIWNFGDGNETTTTDPTINHIYYEKGNYTVTLSVIDADGRTGNLTRTMTITSLAGDINGDGKVDIRDIAIVAKAYGSSPGDPNWNPAADITGPEPNVPDGKVDIRDIALVSNQFGQEA